MRTRPGSTCPAWRRARPWRWALLVFLGGHAALGGGPFVTGRPPRAQPPPPAGCRRVRPGEDLQALLDQAGDGASFCLSEGRYPGPLRIRGRLTVWGPPEATVQSSGEGTTVRLEGDGPALLGLTVDGSGGRFDTLDAAVHVAGSNARVEGVRIQNAVFGILCERASGATVRGNQVIGNPDLVRGMRGDGIRLWETRDSRVEDNLVVDSRDLVVWYSPGNRIAGNWVEASRYGTHFMYSSDSVVERNRYVGNVVGVFVMYSRDITLRQNLIADSTGAAGMGLGLKESGNVRAEHNVLVRYQTGVYIDSSPFQPGDTNRFERNVFRFGNEAVIFHRSQLGNTFAENAFEANQRTVQVQGGGDALGTTWSGNYYDDYTGYDLERDGYGDLPYEARSLSGLLTSNHPQLSFFAGSASLWLVDAISQLAPLFSPKRVMVDPRPRVRSPREEVIRGD